ncbi:MAG: TAXI family TRAP transporter solute-binding subunit, partial [Methyloligellaceae bacterium]
IGGLDIYYFGAFVTKKSGAGSWADIVAAKNGFRLLTTKVGGTGETGVRQVLALMGSSKADVSKKGGSVKAMARKATATAISDGKADGWSHVVTKGHPVATQLTTTNEMMMLPLPGNVADGLVKKHGWIKATVPANTFKGQSAPVSTVKASSNILVAASVPDEVAYTFVKTIMENVDKLKKIHAGLTNFNPKVAADPGFNGNCPLHPGAAKYYKEAGLLK